MSATDKYRRLASECLKLMSTIHDPAHRSLLLNMAAAWTDLAHRAEKNQPHDIVCEPRPSSSVVLQQQQPQGKADKDEG